MNPSPPTTRADPLRVLNRRLSRGNWAGAAELLETLGAVPPSMAEAVGCMWIALQRWERASAAFARAEASSDEGRALDRLARNRVVLDRHRPWLAALLDGTPQTGRYALAPHPGGGETIIDAARGIPLVKGAPAQQRADVASALGGARDFLPPVLIAGLGDGVLLDAVAGLPPSRLGMRPTIYAIEPDAERFHACLLRHDWSDPGGLLAQERVVLLVGPGWVDRLHAELDREPGLPTASMLLSFDHAGQRLIEIYSAAAAEQERRSLAGFAPTLARYAQRGPADFADAIAGRVGRPPRLLVLTSRFTTVLQHSARDSERAFRALGWETKLLIESAEHLGNPPALIRRAITDFEPDAVFVIDHLRHRLADATPPGLPFITWIQDDLAHLMTPQAGASIGDRDFVLTCAATTYANDFGYPRRQCIYLDKLTAFPAVHTPARRDGDDLVFVSNASPTRAALRHRTLFTADTDDDGRALLEASIDAVFDCADRGAALAGVPAMDGLISACERRLGLKPRAHEARRALAFGLFNSVYNVLYRQEALRWAVRIAERLGLTLALYGRGWEANPEFAPFARGPVAYGDELAAVTRSAKVNLQIVPFHCLHQRLLDGWAAGGCFLIREHPIDLALERVAELVRGLPADLADEAAARAARGPAFAAGLDALRLELVRLIPDGGADQVAAYHWYRTQAADWLFDPIPHRAAVSFTDEASLEARVAWALAEPEEAGRVVDEQRAFVEATRSYRTGLANVLREVARRLETEVAPRSNGEPQRVAA